MNRTDELLWMIVLFITVFVLSYAWISRGDDLLDSCYEQLNKSNEAIKSLLLENQNLKLKITELEKETEEFSNTKKLLNEAYDKLKKNNELISDLKKQNDTLRYLYKESQRDLDKLSYKWIFGGSLSYPSGGNFMFGYNFKGFGLFSNFGFIKDPYISAGIFFKK